MAVAVVLTVKVRGRGKTCSRERGVGRGAGIARGAGRGVGARARGQQAEKQEPLQAQKAMWINRAGSGAAEMHGGALAGARATEGMILVAAMHLIPVLALAVVVAALQRCSVSSLRGAASLHQSGGGQTCTQWTSMRGRGWKKPSRQNLQQCQMPQRSSGRPSARLDPAGIWLQPAVASRWSPIQDRSAPLNCLPWKRVMPPTWVNQMSICSKTRGG